MQLFKQFFLPLLKALFFTIFAFKGSEFIFREFGFPVINLLPNPISTPLLQLDYGQFITRLFFFFWSIILYFFTELLLSKHTLHQTILFTQKNKIKTFFKGAIWGISFFILLLLTLIIFQNIQFEGYRKNLLENIGLVCITIFSTFFLAFALELIFRGFILNYLSKSLNIHVAVFITSTLYATMFYVRDFSILPVMEFFLGAFLGYLFLLYGIYSTLGFHFIWKLLESVFLYGNVIYTINYPMKLFNYNLNAEHVLGSILSLFFLCFFLFKKQLLNKKIKIILRNGK